MVAAHGGEADDLKFFFLGGIADVDVEHEAVELGFGKRISAFLLDGVLRGEDEERLREPVLLAAGGDLMLLHGFQQRGLGFGGRAVDFVGEDHVGKDRTADEAEGAAAGGLVFFDDLGAGDVGGHQVGRELDAVEAEAERAREGGDEQRLGQSRHADEQRMALAEQGDEKLLDDGFLADDDLAELGAKVVITFLQFFDGGQFVGSKISGLRLDQTEV